MELQPEDLYDEEIKLSHQGLELILYISPFGWDVHLKESGQKINVHPFASNKEAKKKISEFYDDEVVHVKFL